MSDNSECLHPSIKVEFDIEKAKTMSSQEIQKKYPRGYGVCKECNQSVIKYFSFEHFIYGDW